MAFSRQAVEEYVRKAKKYQRRLRKTDPLFSRFEREENTLVKLAIPFLKILGWGAESKDCAFEYCLSESRKGRLLADIALFKDSGKKPSLIVEVKDTGFSKHAIQEQIPAYLQKSKVEFGVLFNGMHWMVFHIGQKNPLLDVRLKDFVKQRRLLRCFSKKNIGKLSLQRLQRLMPKGIKPRKR